MGAYCGPQCGDSWGPGALLAYRSKRYRWLTDQKFPVTPSVLGQSVDLPPPSCYDAQSLLPMLYANHRSPWSWRESSQAPNLQYK